MVVSTPEPAILDTLDDLLYRAATTLAAIQLDLFTPLKEGPLNVSQIAQQLGVEAKKLQPLLYALVVVGLLTEEAGKFANSAEADHYLVRGRPSYQGHRQKYWSDIWPAAFQIARSIRSGRPQAKHDYAAMSSDELEDFMQGLYPWTYEAGRWLSRNYDFTVYETVLDAAGGSGALSIALAEELPTLRLQIVEQPAVVPVTQRFVDRAGVGQQVYVVAGDLICQTPPGMYDAAILKSFIQTLSLEEAAKVLRNINQSLGQDGCIYIWDVPLDDSRLSPVDIVLFNPVFTAIYDHGQKRTASEYRALLAQSGFQAFALDAMGVITARKSGEAPSPIETQGG